MKNNNILIAPSILSADFDRLGEEVTEVAKNCDYIHIDVMDGHFVPNLTFGPPVIKSIRKCTEKIFDVHLMIANPEKYIESYVNAGADIITIHAETTPHIHKVLQQIKNTGKKAGLAFNPSTPVDTLKYLDIIDMVLIMSVNPGFGGQKFIHSVINKIREVKQIIPDVAIEIDGGITNNTIKSCFEAGATIFVAGSFIFGADDYAYQINLLREAIK